MGEAVGLSGSATASAVDLSKLPPLPAVALPKDATPVAELPAPVTPTVELPHEPTPTLTYDGGFLSWLPPLEVLVGGGPRVTSVGLSVNGADPYKSYDGGSVFSLRTSVLLTPKTVGIFDYYTQPFLFGQMDNLNGPLGELWSVGLGTAFRLVYPTGWGALAIAPDLAASLGIFWMKEPADVGAGDKNYWAYTGYQFPQLQAGLGVYTDVPLKGYIVTAGIKSGYRWLWHGNQMSPLPGQDKTTVGLQSTLFEALQLLLGVRF